VKNPPRDHLSSTPSHSKRVVCERRRIFLTSSDRRPDLFRHRVVEQDDRLFTMQRECISRRRQCPVNCALPLPVSVAETAAAAAAAVRHSTRLARIAVSLVFRRISRSITTAIANVEADRAKNSLQPSVQVIAYAADTCSPPNRTTHLNDSWAYVHVTSVNVFLAGFTIIKITT